MKRRTLLSFMLFVPLARTASANGANESTASEALERLKVYYAAINRRHFRTALNIWERGDDGASASGQTYAQFKAGFAATKKVQAMLGPPGLIDGAAGSNFIEIPITIKSWMMDGTARKFAGTYTLRSSNVSDDHRWYIFKAKIQPVA